MFTAHEQKITKVRIKACYASETKMSGVDGSDSRENANFWRNKKKWNNISFYCYFIRKKKDMWKYKPIGDILTGYTSWDFIKSPCSVVAFKQTGVGKQGSLRNEPSRASHVAFVEVLARRALVHTFKLVYLRLAVSNVWNNINGFNILL